MDGAMRTQIYLTVEQRRRLDASVRRDSHSLAHVVREALDAYLAHAAAAADAARALDETFGSLPDLDVPSRDEWFRG